MSIPNSLITNLLILSIETSSNLIPNLATHHNHVSQELIGGRLRRIQKRLMKLLRHQEVHGLMIHSQLMIPLCHGVNLDMHKVRVRHQWVLNGKDHLRWAKDGQLNHLCLDHLVNQHHKELPSKDLLIAGSSLLPLLWLRIQIESTKSWKIESTTMPVSSDSSSGSRTNGFKSMLMTDFQPVRGEVDTDHGPPRCRSMEQCGCHSLKKLMQN